MTEKEKVPDSVDLREVDDPAFSYTLKNGDQGRVDPFEIEERMRELGKDASDMIDNIRAAFGLLTKAEYKKAREAYDAAENKDGLKEPYLTTRHEALALWQRMEAYTASLETVKKLSSLMQPSLASTTASATANG